VRTETVIFDGVTAGIEDKGGLVESRQLFEWVGVSGRVNWPRAQPGRLAARDQGSARVTVFAAPMNDQGVPTELDEVGVFERGSDGVESCSNSDSSAALVMLPVATTSRR
jgi:hypothetical protein